MSWLKFDACLPEKPETLAITVAMGWDDPDLTVGKLMRAFRWFDQHTVDGNAVGVTCGVLDRVIGATGFAQAMISVGWLIQMDNGIYLSNFERHNGETAKSRALTAKRVANHRASVLESASEKTGNASRVTGALPREEKRREERILVRFDKFYAEYPKKQSKLDALKAFTSIDPDDELLTTIIAAVIVQRSSEAWRKDKGKFVPLPASWLRARRWEDELETAINGTAYDSATEALFARGNHQ